MQWRNTPTRYGFIGQSLHWLVVLGLVAAYFIAEAAEDNDSGRLLALHRSVGITILALAAARALWRLVDRRPTWPAEMRSYERLIARATHLAFYAMLFALPLTGWLASSAEGEAVRYFGLFELPPLGIGASEEMLEDVHELMFNTLLGLAALHVVGALKHHFWDRDRVLASMLPIRGRRTPARPRG